MKRTDQKNPLPGHLAAAGQKPKWIKWLLASSIFLTLLIVVFLLSYRVAEKTVVGFPNFHDSEFALLDQNGETRFPSDFAGKPIALFFGFTYCPDICPTTLMMLTGIRDQLATEAKAADHLQILFVTVDPERDTPAQLHAYLGLFDTSVTGLTGTREDIDLILTYFGVYAKRIGDNDEYLYDHNAAVYLFRQDGNFKGTIVHGEQSEYMVEKLKSIL
jgi:protein SCO1/2